MSLSCSKTSLFPLCLEYNPTASPNLQGSSQSAASLTTSTSPTFPLATSDQPPVLWIPKLTPTSGPFCLMFSLPGMLLFDTLLSSLRSFLKFHLIKAAFPDHPIQNSPLHFVSYYLLYPFFMVLITTRRDFPGSPPVQAICLAPMRHSVDICWMNKGIFPTQAWGWRRHKRYSRMLCEPRLFPEVGLGMKARRSILVCVCVGPWRNNTFSSKCSWEVLEL